jgi:hypothetical protein
MVKNPPNEICYGIIERDAGYEMHAVMSATAIPEA